MCNVTASLAKHPRYDSRRPKQSSGLVLSPVTLLLGDKDGAGNPGLYNLVGLEIASRCIGPDSNVESGP